MHKTDKDLIKAFRMRMSDFNIAHITGTISNNPLIQSDSTIMSIALIRCDSQFLHLGSKYGELLSYRIYNTYSVNWLNRLLNKEEQSLNCSSHEPMICDMIKQKSNKKFIDKLRTGFFLDIDDIDVLHIAKWVIRSIKKYGNIYLHQLSNLSFNQLEYMWKFWSKYDTPEKIFIAHDLNEKF